MSLKYYPFLLWLFWGMQVSFADDAIPNFFDASYILYRNDTKIGLVERAFFKHENGHYVFRSQSRTTGFIALFRKDRIVEESHWQFINSDFQPMQYRYQRTGGNKDRTVKIDFNWDKQQIDNYINDSVWHMQTAPGVLDKLLYQLVIMAKLQSGIVPDSFIIADGGKIKRYLFHYVKDEIIKTPLGQFNTMKIVRQRPNSEHITELWCAYDLNFLPIKVVNIEKEGAVTSVIIESLNGFGFNKKTQKN